MIFHDLNKYSFFLANFHFKAKFPLITTKKEGFTILRRKFMPKEIKSFRWDQYK